MTDGEITLPDGRKLTTLKVAELKKELTARHLPVTGKKAELKERLEQSILGAEKEDEEEHESGEEEAATEPPKGEKQQQQDMEREEEEARFITPDREMDGPEEDPTHRKSTKASRARPAYLQATNSREPSPLKGNPYLSEDDDDVAVKDKEKTRRSATRTLSPSPYRSRHGSREASSSSRVSAIAMRTRSRSPCVEKDAVPLPTPLNVSGTPQRPLSERKPPRSALPPVPTRNSASRLTRVQNNVAASAPRLSARRTLLGTDKSEKRPAQTKKSDDEPPEKRLTTKPPLPHGTLKGRFAALHQKIYDNEETLQERHDRKQKRREDLTKNVPDVVTRLHTPKQALTRPPLRNQNSEIKGEAFKFNPIDISSGIKFGDTKAEDIQRVQRDPKTTQAVPGPSRAGVNVQERLDVKGRTKKNPATRKLTIPDDDTFTEFISAPKGTTPKKTPIRTGYTPKRGAVKKFVDTTKLNFEELQLAKEEGLIPGASATKALSANVMNFKKRSEAVLAIRRKLNV